jgi:hypothetical protein
MSDDVGGMLGNLLVDLLALLRGMLGRFLGFLGCFLCLLSCVLSLLGQFLGAGFGSGLSGGFLGLLSGDLSFVSVVGSSLGGVLGVLLLLHEGLGLKFGESLFARFLAVFLVSGDSSSSSSSHGDLGEVLGLLLSLDGLLLKGYLLLFLSFLLGSLSLNLFGFNGGFSHLFLELSSGLGGSGSLSNGFSLGSSLGLISGFLGSEDGFGLNGVLLGKVGLHFSLESSFLGFDNFLGLFLFVDFMEGLLADMYVFDNNLLSVDFLGDFSNLLDLRFLSFHGVSSLLDDLGHGFLSLGLCLLFGLGDGLLNSFFNEVGSLLLDACYSLGCTLLDNFSLSDSSLSLGLLFLKSGLSIVLEVRDGLLGSSLAGSKRCFAGSVSGGNSNLGGLGSFFLGLDEFSNNLNKFLNLMLSLVSELLNTGMFAFHGGHHRLQLLLDELGLDVADLLLFLMNMEGFAHLSVLSIDDRQSLFKFVLVHLNLRKVGVNHLHGVLTSSGEGHNVIPMLKDELVSDLADLLFLDSDITVFHTSPEESPAGDSLRSVKGRALVDTGQITVPDVSLAVKNSKLVRVKNIVVSKVGSIGESNGSLGRYLSQVNVLFLDLS